MGVSRVAGHPDYTSAGTSKFIPELWSTKILKKYYMKTVFTQIANTSYEGEIKDFGDKVYIRTVADVTTFDWSKGMTLPKQRPESPDVELLIDKAKGWNLLLDDVDKIQSDIDLLNSWTNDAAKQLKIAVDSAGLAYVITDSAISAYNYGATAGKISAGYNLGASGSPIQITKTNVTDYIDDCGTVLGENDVPEEGSWLVMPEWMGGMIRKSDIKDASMTGDSKSVMRTNVIGRLGRFNLMTSNQLPTVAAVTDASGFKCYYALFGNMDAITFATQLTKTESLRSTESFDTIVRGLMVYGYKVIKGQALGYMYIRK